MIGDEDNGYWLLRPDCEIREVRRRYREETLILETEFITDHGAVRVVDFMPQRTTAPDVVRIVEGVRGEVPMRMELVVRFDYGSIIPWIRKDEDGHIATAGPDTIRCSTPVELTSDDGSIKAKFSVRKTDWIPFTLTWSRTHEEPPSVRDSQESLSSTETWWRNWAAKCSYQGEWREAVLRSLLTLKALIYAPTGGIVAAPTMSLPEQYAGKRNWDYRYCWVRDATLTLYSLMMGGYKDEAKEWRGWLERAVAGTPADLQIMYGISGERRLPEHEIPWLSGYEGATPVRVGNAAFSQFQLDVYGEVLDSMYVAQRHGLNPTEDSWRVLKSLLEFLQEKWDQPDQGIWEMRGKPRHFTHSKMMAWVGLDRGVHMVEHFGLPGDAKKWKAQRDRLHKEICEKGFDRELNSFVLYFGAKDPDASLLLMPSVGFLPADDPRVIGTTKCIQEQLMSDGFVRRYRNDPEVDGLPPGEGSFLPCSFWLADNLAQQGRQKEARALFERLLAIRNDVGLLPEIYDTERKRFLGNFPQAFTHVGLINTACNLDAIGESPAEDRKHSEQPA